MRRHSLIGLCAGGMLATALAACGGSTTVVTDTTAANGPSASSAATTSAGSGTTTIGSSSSSATSTSAATNPAATLPRCTAGRLALSFLGQQGATGHGEIAFALRNTGTGACHTFGFPGILFLSDAGAPLPTATQRVTRDFFGSAPATALILAPGQRASFRLGVTHGQASSAGCVTAAALQVIPPDDTQTLRVSIPNGAYECGTATVSPLRPGTAAFG